VSSPVVLTTMILLIMTFLPFCLAAGGGEGASAGPGTDVLTRVQRRPARQLLMDQCPAKLS